MCDSSAMAGPAIASLAEEHFDDLKPLWRALYEHHTALTPHLRDREVPFEKSWETRRGLERGWLSSEPRSFVLVAQDADGCVGYAFVRVRSGDGFAASWRVSDPLAELATLAVLPEVRGQGVGSALLDAVEARLRELEIHDMVIAVVTNNSDAMRLYERRGAVPFVTQFIHRLDTDND